MKVSLQEIRNSLGEEKNKGDSLWVRCFIRKVAFYTAFCAINAGLSAWMVSVLSIFVSVGGSACLCVDNTIIQWIGVILIELWIVMDCTDGNIARTTKTTSPKGEFIDAESGYYVCAFVFFALGVAAFHTSSLLSDKWSYLWIIMGAIASISNLLARLIFQKYTATMLQAGEISPKKDKSYQEEKRGLFQFLRRRVGKELGISGLLMPAIIIAQIFKLYAILCAFYFIYFVAALVFITVMYSKKAKV